MATEGGVHRLVTCVVVGAGERGTVYSKFATAFPDRLRVVGVAEPRKSTKAAFSASVNSNKKSNIIYLICFVCKSWV